MTDQPRPTPNRFAPGCILAAAPLIGVPIGMREYHSPSLGIVVGFGVGVVLATLFWLIERRR